MKVKQSDVERILKQFHGAGFYALDTETTGLHAAKGDRLFSLILSNEQDNYYFNFLSYPDIDPAYVLSREETIPLLRKALANKDATWFMHNAKFDLSMLAAEGLSVAGDIHDTVVGGRIENNARPVYTLSALVKELGVEKSDEVEDYIKKNNLYSVTTTHGKEEKKPRYDLVPFDIISRYGEKDGDITLKLGLHQIAALKNLDKKIAAHLNINPSAVMATEKRLTKTLFKMEQIGIKIDYDLCQRSYDAGNEELASIMQEYKDKTGYDLVDSGKAHAVAFAEAGYKYPKTAKGNPCFNKEVLQKMDCPLARVVVRYRQAAKNNNTYYANFMSMSDADHVIHCNFRQSGTLTGRMSCSHPNLQNIPKDKEDDTAETLSVRRAFIPRPDYCFVMIDYDQMEYRLMLDYAQEKSVIRKILKKGLDVHTATAEEMGVKRFTAKTLNFLLIFGGGIQKLADALKLSYNEAKIIKRNYFKALPNVAAFIDMVVASSRRRGWVHNWAGRICYQDKGFEYRAANHLIQGGCADIVKRGMNDLDEFLEPYKSRMVLQVHDEVIFEIHKSELHIVTSLKILMERAYPHKHIPLTCGVDHSWVSWGDKVKGLPSE